MKTAKEIFAEYEKANTELFFCTTLEELHEKDAECEALLSEHAKACEAEELAKEQAIVALQAG
jgi:hypothetical protein